MLGYLEQNERDFSAGDLAEFRRVFPGTEALATLVRANRSEHALRRGVAELPEESLGSLLRVMERHARPLDLAAIAAHLITSPERAQSALGPDVAQLERDELVRGIAMLTCAVYAGAPVRPRDCDD
jgi:hypothetical protein